jgi:hypothetical protein
VLGCIGDWEVVVLVGPDRERSRPARTARRPPPDWLHLVEFGSDFGSTDLYVRRTSRTIAVRIKHAYFDEEFSFRRTRTAREPRADAERDANFVRTMFDSAFAEAVDAEWAITTDEFESIIESIGTTPWNPGLTESGERDEQGRRARWLDWSKRPHRLGR